MTDTSSTSSTPPVKKRGSKKPAAIIAAAIAVVIIAILIFTLPLFLTGASADAVIKIPAGASRENVRDSLSKHLGEGYAAKVMRVASLKGTDFSGRHGAYLITEGMSPARAERRLSQGGQHPLTVTINGFRTLQRLADKMSQRLDFSADSLIKAATDPAMLRKYGLSPDQALALFVDDSYEVYWSVSPEALIKKIGDNYEKIWNQERRSKAARLGLTPAEVMTLCSIVDEESNKADEKGKIGRLYINRLKIGMPLQADPTVKFAVGDFSIRRVTKQHLITDSPYNTYRNRGLPPGPIRTTSIATIDRVLDSEPSGYLYMCAKEDFSGYHNFASSLAEHRENARRYQKELDKRGIK